MKEERNFTSTCRTASIPIAEAPNPDGRAAGMTAASVEQERWIKCSGMSVVWPSSGPAHSPVSGTSIAQSLCATGGATGELVLWRDCYAACVCTGHSARITAITSCCDNSRVLSADARAELRLWCASSGRCIARSRLFGHPANAATSLGPRHAAVASELHATIFDATKQLSLSRRLSVGLSCGTLRALRCDARIASSSASSLKLWASPANGRARCWIDPMHPAFEAEDDQLESWAEHGFEENELLLQSSPHTSGNMSPEGSTRNQARFVAAPPPERCVALSPDGANITVSDDGGWELVSSEGKTLAENGLRDPCVISACFDSRGKLALLAKSGKLDVRAPGKYLQPHSGEVGLTMPSFAASDDNGTAVAVFEQHSGSGFVVLYSHPASLVPVSSDDQTTTSGTKCTDNLHYESSASHTHELRSSLHSSPALVSDLLPNKRGIAIATTAGGVCVQLFEHAQLESGRTFHSDASHTSDVLCLHTIDAGAVITGGSDARVLVHSLPTLELEAEFKHHNAPVRLCASSALPNGSSITGPTLLLCCSDNGSCSVMKRSARGQSWSTPLILNGFDEPPLEASLLPLLGFACCRGEHSRSVAVWDTFAGTLDRIVQSEIDGDWLLAQGNHTTPSPTGALIMGGDVAFSHMSADVPDDLAVLELAFAHPWQISEQADRNVVHLLKNHANNSSHNSSEFCEDPKESPLQHAGIAIEGAGGATTLAVSAGSECVLATSPRTVSERSVACMALSGRALHVHGLDHWALSSLQNFYADVRFALHKSIAFPSLPYYAAFYCSVLEDVSSAAWTLLEYATRAKPLRPHHETEWDQEEDSTGESERMSDIVAIADASVCLVMNDNSGAHEDDACNKCAQQHWRHPMDNDALHEYDAHNCVSEAEEREHLSWHEATSEACRNLVKVTTKMPSREGVQAVELLAERVGLWTRHVDHKLPRVAMRAAKKAGHASKQPRLGLRSTPHDASVHLLACTCIDDAQAYLRALEDLMQQSSHDSVAMPRALEALAHAAQARPSALLYYLLGTVEALLLASNPGLASLRRAWQPYALWVLQELARVIPCVNLNRRCMRLAVASPERKHPAASVYDIKHGSHYRDLDVQDTSLNEVDAIGVDDSGYRIAAYSRAASLLAVWVLPPAWRDALSLRASPLRAKHVAPVPFQEPHLVGSGEVSSGMDPRFEVEWIGDSGVAVTRDGVRIVRCSIGVGL